MNSDHGKLVKPAGHPAPDFNSGVQRQFDKHFVEPHPWAEARCTYADIKPGEIFRITKFSEMRYIKMEDRNEEGNRRYIYLGSGEISGLNILREDVVYRDSVLRKYSR